MATESLAFPTSTSPALRSNAPLYFSVPVLALCIGCFALFFGWERLSPALVDGCSSVFGDSPRCASGINKIRIYTLAFACFPLILLLERWRPADPKQAAFSAGMVTDAWWFLFFPILGVWLPTAFEEILNSLLGPAIGGMRMALLGSVPVVAQIVIVALFSDLLAYVSHLIRHKVPLFWEFHKIHHSQEQLNYFSSVRVHPLDLIVNSAIRFLPFTLLGMEMAVPAFIGWITFQRFYEMFVHANLRTNLGWLRYILVTPQSHRIHHSIEKEHIDTNYANIFSIWDHLFGTQVRDYDAYPLLGVHDPDVPHNRSPGLIDGARTFVAELIYPLVALSRSKR